jgi:hypothetical protein
VIVAYSNDRNLTLFEGLIEFTDPAKLKRFDELAAEFGYGRNLIALLSKPAGSSEHLWGRQFQLRGQGKDATSVCCETQDLFGSLVADFLAAAVAGRFSVWGFIGAVIQTLDPALFGIPRLRLRLDENRIELPDGSTIPGIYIVGAPQSDEEPKNDRQTGRRGGGRSRKPIWKRAKVEAMTWLDTNGYPEPGDGGQADLEKYIADWLADRDLHPVESTIRVHVSGWIAEYRDSLG